MIELEIELSRVQMKQVIVVIIVKGNCPRLLPLVSLVPPLSFVFFTLSFKSGSGIVGGKYFLPGMEKTIGLGFLLLFWPAFLPFFDCLVCPCLPFLPCLPCLPWFLLPEEKKLKQRANRTSSIHACANCFQIRTKSFALFGIGHYPFQYI